jgi:hypothetical protein
MKTIRFESSNSLKTLSDCGSTKYSSSLYIKQFIACPFKKTMPNGQPGAQALT